MVANRWFTFLFLLAMPPLVAHPLPSRTLSLQQGLPDYFVTGIVQDKAGFIWVATLDGLARYDGLRFKLFRHRPHDHGSISSNILIALQSVSDSVMLIHLENDGFQLFNPITEQFSDLLSEQQLNHHHLNMPQAALSPDRRELWARQANRLIRYRPQSSTFSIYPFPPIILPKDVSFGNSFILDTQGTFYAPHPGGLVTFHPQTQRFHQWFNSTIVEHGTIRNFLETPIIRRATGELLIGGVRQLISFNPKTGRFRSLPVPQPIDTKVGIMHAGVDGNVYFTCAMTVYRLTPDDHITALWTAARIDYQNYFHALLLDRSGVLWVGTNGDGVQQLDLYSLPIRSYAYRTNFINDLLTRELGLPAPRWAKSSDIQYRLRWGGQGAYATTRFNEQYHLFKLDLSRRKLRTLLVTPKPPELPTHHEGNGLRVLADGTIWMADIYHGLLKANTAGQILEQLPIPNDKISDIQPLGPWIWIGSEFNGLYAYDPRTRRIVRRLRYIETDSTSLVSDHIWCLAADPHNSALLWVGTQEGLSRLDTRMMRFKNWTQKQGLPSTTINTLLIDRQGQLWFSTLDGISRMDPRTGQLRRFTTADGLLDTGYKPFLGAQLPDGRLAFGGLTGVTTFEPTALGEAPLQPIPTVLTALKINNIEVEPGSPAAPLSRPLNATSTLRLEPTQNFLSLEYAGLQYNKPTTLQYRYQLTGIDADWVYVGNQTVANYTQLAPGSYTFRVNAADALGHWSTFIKTIRIEITPPWWRTWWFYLLVTMAFISSMYGLYRYRLAQVLRLQNLRNDIARDLHDEIGSSLSSIAIYSKIVLEQVGASTFKSESLLVKITEQANEIMGSMNDIVWSINTKNDAFDKVFIRMREHASQLLEAKGYTLHFDFDENLHRTKLNMERRRDFYLIYKEALNNIAKYANGRNVWISVHLRHSGIDLLIRDDGLGFAVNAVLSNGNGLSNMNYRATALKGALQIVSEPTKGTTLHLSF